MADKLAAFYGKVHIFQRDANGNPINGAWIGDVSDLSLSQSAQTSKHNESYSGFNALASVVTTSRDMSVSMKAHDYSLKNLARYMYATATQIAGATGYVQHLGAAAAGETKLLDHINIDPSGAFIVTNGTTPLVEGEDFTVERGTGTMVFITAQTDVTVTYDYLGFGQAAMFTTADNTNWYIRLSGFNKVDGTPVVVDLYKVRLEPISNLTLINKNHGEYDIKGDVLWDSTKPVNGPLGCFARIRQVG